MNIHDTGYKLLFANKGIFRQLLETFVAEEWVKDLDFDTCERLDKSFVSEHYKETEGDLIYKIKLREKEVFIIILIEFQSTVEWFMGLRILNYISNFWMDYVHANPQARKLPAVFPILLYNGNEKWTAPTNLANLIEGNEYLGKFALNFEYFKIAENEYSIERLLKIRNVVSTLFLAEAHYDPELLKEELLRVYEKEEDKVAISVFLNWFFQLKEHGRIPAADYADLERVYKGKEEVKAMLITSLQKERKELEKELEKEFEQKFEQKLKSELEKNYEKAKLEERLNTVKTMIAKGFDVTLIAEITGLPQETILALKVDGEKN
jgi:predicted transposase/invertase (TIGR01784 family)